MPAHRSLSVALTASVLLLLAACSDEGPKPRNLILFVPDGLRALQVNPETAPAMAALRERGVNFANPHALFPTFTMPNASGMATGHYLGDTGDFSNTIYTGYPVPPTGSVTPFIENDAVLGDIDAHFAGDYLNETTILNAARVQGFSTAAIGKLGPTLQFDHTERSGERTITVDDSTGSPSGIPLSEAMKAALTQAGLPLAAPSRGDNGKPGDFKTPGATVANVDQQAYFANVAAKVVLPMFKARKQPFVLVFWSRDPDGTQHNQGDSLNALTPGINGPTSLAAVKNADNNLKQLIDALRDLGLADSTDIVVAADHGFSTISKESETSLAAKGAYADVPEGRLPPGFVAIDIAKALSLPLFDPDSKNAAVADNAYPRLGNGLIGQDPAKPDVVIAANGGSDLVYLPTRDRDLAARVVAILLKQDYVSGLFVDDDLGKIPGTLPLTSIGLKGSAITPYPAIVVNFRSYSTGCPQPLLCTVAVADTRLQQGQGMHGSFSRADTMNFMAAAGPSFKAGFVDPGPVSNADVGKTIAKVLGISIPFKGMLAGRVIEEALPGGEVPASVAGVIRSEPSAEGLVTLLAFQRVGTTVYFGAAGFPDRTIGLPAQTASR
ncbi:MAG TPA: alkaline phosphatase family protein [Xanthobacteraceae bacterium]|nr:alkaline phosphatase family protein [Xanthobacteraceae bacterium]